MRDVRRVVGPRNVARQEIIRYSSETMFSGKKKPLLVPDPGQRVELLVEDGSRRAGFRAVSAPFTSETGEVAIRVATEKEYEDARLDERHPVSMTWPARRVVVPIPWWKRQRWLTRRN